MLPGGALRNDNSAAEFPVIIGFFIAIGYIYVIIIVFYDDIFLVIETLSGNLNLSAYRPLLGRLSQECAESHG